MSAGVAMADEPTLEELALRAQRGERDCFEVLSRRIEPRLRAFVVGRLAGRDPDDVVQDTFAKALASLDRYDPRYRFSTWLFTIAANTATSQLRAERRTSAEVEAVAAAGDPARALGERADGARLWKRAAEVLGAAQYEILWLRYAEERSVAEIARHTGRTAISVRVSLYRARKRLLQEVD